MRIHDSGDIEISDFSRLSSAPVVSVQMLTYQHAAYLDEAIEGVLAQQTDFPIELLVADDASTDGAGEIAKRYQRMRPDIVRIVTGPANIGARANRYRTARRIRGEFVAFCEGDDYWTDPLKIQRQVDYLRAHPEAGAVHTDFDHLLMRGRHWRRLPNFQKHRYAGGDVPTGKVFSTLLRSSFVQTCTLCIRADIDRAFLADFLLDSYPVGDWPLSIYVAAAHEIGFLRESTAVYRRVTGSMMNAGRTTRARMTAAYIPMIESVCDRMEVPEIDRVQALLPLYHALFSQALFAGESALLRQVLEWLRENDESFLSPWWRRLKIYLARLPVFHETLAVKYEVSAAIDEWLRYRPEAKQARRTDS